MRAITLFFAVQVLSASCLLVSANDHFIHSDDASGTTEVNEIMKPESLAGNTKENGDMEEPHGTDSDIQGTRLDSHVEVAPGSVNDPADTHGYEPLKKHPESDDVPLSFVQINDEPRTGHLIKIYDMTRKVFTDDGEIRGVQVTLLPKTEFPKDSNSLKPSRSDDPGSLKDLEENSTRDFQPLFSAREEPAKQRSARLVEAYGVPKKVMDSNGEIERVQASLPPRAEVSRQSLNSMSSRARRSIDAKSSNKFTGLNSQEAKILQSLFVDRKETSARRKSGRLLDTYGAPKDPLNKNNQVHRWDISIAPTVEMRRYYRTTRSIDEESKNGMEDLEGQDAKVFRPLFVYRQQVAARQRRLEEKKRKYAQKSHPSRQTTNPYVYRGHFY